MYKNKRDLKISASARERYLNLRDGMTGLTNLKMGRGVAAVAR